MEQVGAAAVCLIVTVTVLSGFIKGLPVFKLFSEGATEGAKAAFRILPTLIGLITAITMLRASGFLELLAQLLQGVADEIGLESELIPLMLLRPLSGSGAVSYVTELMGRYGAESHAARAAVILSSSTETTFYAAAVYFGGRGYKSVRYTVPAALCGDFAAIALTLIAVRLFG